MDCRSGQRLTPTTVRRGLRRCVRQKARVMIKPTVGRVVWFYEAEMSNDDQPYPAIICFVHSDTCINVAGFDNDGNQFKSTLVTLEQEGIVQPTSRGPRCKWISHQMGQAAKAEKLQKQLAAR